MDPKPPNKFEVYLDSGFAGLLLFCAVLALIVAAKTSRLPVQFDYEEGNIVNAGLRITQGQTPYPAPGGWPIVLSPYGPIPYLLTAMLVKWFGVGFFAPRMVSLLCGVTITLLIGLLLRRLGGSIPASIIFSCLFLSVASIRNWLLTCRVDWLALLFSFGGLAVCVFWEKRWYVAALLFSAAFFVKYSLLAAPFACGIWFLTRKDWRTVVRVIASSIVFCGVGFWITQRWSGGNFAFHQFGTHPDPYVFAQFLRYMKERIQAIPLPFGMAVAGVAVSVVHRKVALPVIYFLTSTAGALTVGKAGSNTNHLIEWTAAICWCAGYAWQFIEAWLVEKKLRVARALAMTAVAATSVLAFATYRLPMEDRTSCGPTYAFLKSHGDKVLTDSVGALLVAQEPVLVSNPFVYTQLVSYGGWADVEVKPRVLAKEFDVILLRDQIEQYPPDTRFTADTLRAIKQNYHEGAAFECFDSGFAYVPNP
jgi:hypothetical protein